MSNNSVEISEKVELFAFLLFREQRVFGTNCICFRCQFVPGPRPVLSGYLFVALGCF